MKLLHAGVVVLLLASASPGARAELYPVPFEQRSERAERIVVGELVKQTPFWVEGRGVVTANTVRVKAWLKGISNEQEVIVLTLGGVFGDRATIASPSLELEYGQDYLVFLDREEQQLHDPELKLRRPDLRQSFAYADVQGAMPLFVNDEPPLSALR